MVGLREGHAGGAKRVDVRRLQIRVAARAVLVVTEIVHDNDDDIRCRARMGAQPRERPEAADGARG